MAAPALPSASSPPAVASPAPVSAGCPRSYLFDPVLGPTPATLRVAVDEAFAIALPVDPAGAATWRLDRHLDDARVRLVGQVAMSPAAGAAASGNTVFLFKAMAPGTTTIALGFGPPGRKHTSTSYALTVDPAPC